MQQEALITKARDTIVELWPHNRVARIALWAAALQRVPVGALRAGIRYLPEHSSEFPPTPGQFRRICLDLIRPQEEESVYELRELDQVGLEWQETCYALARRIWNFEPRELEYEYAEGLASLIQLPEGPSVEEHRAAFAALRELFDEAHIMREK